MADGEGRVALHTAAAGGQLSSLKALRKLYQPSKGVFDLRDYQGHTPLHAASERGHTQVVHYLLRLQADLAAATRDMEEPLHLAARQGHTSVLDVLLTWRADVSKVSGSGSSALHAAVVSGCRDAAEVLLKRRASVEAHDMQGNQALHIAAKYDDSVMAKLLIAWRADISDPGEEGPAWTVARRHGFRDLAQLLQTKNAMEL